MNQTKGIRIYTATKSIIDKEKGSMNTPQYLHKAVMACIGAKQDPLDKSLGDMNKGFDRIVKIIRAIEKSKIDNILFLLRNEKLEDANQEKSEFSLEEVHILLHVKDTLQKALETEQKRGRLLRERIRDSVALLRKIFPRDEVTSELISAALSKLQSQF